MAAPGKLAGKYLLGGAKGGGGGGVKRKLFRLAAFGGSLTFVMGVGLPYEMVTASRSWQEEREAAHMSRLMRSTQSGPFGTGDRPYGMGGGFGGSAGMTLAAHYASNRTGIRNPFFGLVGHASGMGGIEPAARFMGG